MPRPSGRAADQLRSVTIETGVNAHAEGSCLITMGQTKVLCTASVDEKIPGWMRAQGVSGGWITAEYGMLPRATHDRIDREATKGKQSGRTLEIQRLIGRSLRSVTDMNKLGQRTIWLDCDVIQADGGTRTAAVTGAYVALYIAIQGLMDKNKIKEMPLQHYLAAVSCGIVNGQPMLDLDYSEDSTADADANYVMTQNEHLVEIQITAEKHPLSASEAQQLMHLAQKGTQELIKHQQSALNGLSGGLAQLKKLNTRG